MASPSTSRALLSPPPAASAETASAASSVASSTNTYPPARRPASFAEASPLDRASSDLDRAPALERLRKVLDQCSKALATHSKRAEYRDDFGVMQRGGEVLDSYKSAFQGVLIVFYVFLAALEASLWTLFNASAAATVTLTSGASTPAPMPHRDALDIAIPVTILALLLDIFLLALVGSQTVAMVYFPHLPSPQRVAAWKGFPSLLTTLVGLLGLGTTVSLVLLYLGVLLYTWAVYSSATAVVVTAASAVALAICLLFGCLLYCRTHRPDADRDPTSDEDRSYMDKETLKLFKSDSMRKTKALLPYIGLQHRVHELRSELTDLNKYMSKDDFRKIIAAVYALKEWLEKNDAKDFDIDGVQHDAQRRALEAVMNPVMGRRFKYDTARQAKLNFESDVHEVRIWLDREKRSKGKRLFAASHVQDMDLEALDETCKDAEALIITISGNFSKAALEQDPVITAREIVEQHRKFRQDTNSFPYNKKAKFLEGLGFITGDDD